MAPLFTMTALTGSLPNFFRDLAQLGHTHPLALSTLSCPRLLKWIVYYRRSQVQILPFSHLNLALSGSTPRATAIYWVLKAFTYDFVCFSACHDFLKQHGCNETVIWMIWRWCWHCALWHQQFGWFYTQHFGWHQQHWLWGQLFVLRFQHQKWQRAKLTCNLITLSQKMRKYRNCKLWHEQ